MKRRRGFLKVISASLIAVMLLCPTLHAEEEAASIDTTATTPVIDEETRSSITLDELYALEMSNEETATQNAYNMSIATNALVNWPQGPQTYGESGIIMDAKSGAILYAKNIDGKAYPASITKVLTALIALENGKPEDKITFTDSCIDFLEYGDAHIGMSVGEEITLNDALHALLLASANEVAYAIGANVGESYDWFIQQMNTRARELGAVNSNFVNTNGLHDDNHYTTARDMALISSELLLSHEEFKTISQTLQYTIPPTNLQPEARIFQQKHKMFYPQNDYYYEYVVAGKTGYTDQAMNTLVTCADNGDMQLVCVVMKTHGRNVYPDTRGLFDYAYNNFHKLEIGALEKSEQIQSMEDGAYVVLPDGVSFEDLDMKITEDVNNPENGTAVYTYQGNKVGEAEVTLVAEKEETVEDSSSGKKQEANKNVSTIKTVVKWIIIGLVTAIILLVILMVVLIIRKKRHLAKKQKRKRKRKNNKKRQ